MKKSVKLFFLALLVVMFFPCFGAANDTIQFKVVSLVVVIVYMNKKRYMLKK